MKKRLPSIAAFVMNCTSTFISIMAVSLTLPVFVKQSIASESVSLTQTQATKSDAPSYGDTVKWIQGHIGEAGFPAYTDSDSKSGLVSASDDAQYSAKFDRCKMHLTLTEHMHITNTKPISPVDQTNSDTSMSATFILPIGDIAYALNTPIAKPQDWERMVLDSSYYRDLPTVSIVLPPSGAGTYSYNWSTTDESFNPKANTVNNIPITRGMFSTNVVINPIAGYATASVIQISYARPGTEDAPQHMANALSHLRDLCKKNTNQGSKDLF